MESTMPPSSEPKSGATKVLLVVFVILILLALVGSYALLSQDYTAPTPVPTPKKETIIDPNVLLATASPAATLKATTTPKATAVASSTPTATKSPTPKPSSSPLGLTNPTPKPSTTPLPLSL